MENIPDEILSLIGSFLKSTDFSNVRQLGKTFKKMNGLFKLIFKQNFKKEIKEDVLPFFFKT